MNTIRNDTKGNNAEVGIERHVELSQKETEDMQRRALSIFTLLANRKVRPAEGEAMRLGFDRREGGDTNWLCIALSAELAKAGFEMKITDDGDAILRKVKKG